jgi:hypothetical protein
MGSGSRLGDLLVNARVIDDLQLRSALARQDQWGGRLTRIVVEMGFADEDRVAGALALALKLPRVRLNEIHKDAAAVAKVELAVAQEHGIVPVSLQENGKVLLVAMTDPTNALVVDRIERLGRVRIRIAVIGEGEFSHAVYNLYPGATLQVLRVQTRGNAPTEEELRTQRHEEQFDLAGEEMVIETNAAAPPLRVPANPGAAAVPAPPAAPSAAPSSAASGVDAQRLRALMEQQQRISAYFRAVGELLREKGIVSAQELAARLQK